MKPKDYEKFILMIELGAIYLLLFCCTLRVHSEYTLGYTSCGAINEGMLSNKSFSRN